MGPDELTSDSLLARSPASAAALAALVAAAVVALDLITPPALNLAILKTIPLFICAVTRSRRLLWGMTAALVVVSAFVFALDAHDLSDAVFFQVLVNRLMAICVLIVAAAILHLWIGRDLDARQHERDLINRNEDLSRREEEIARQNEELQSQTEELERQTEELRVTNEELARREKMLQSLLDLSRGLTVELTPDQTMIRICESLGELINGPGTAAAIKEKRGDQMVIVCHSGFGPDGPECDSIPYEKAFASLVLERGRTGFLEDISTRPDLIIPHPKTGPRHVAVLAAPLRVGGRVTGTLEIFSTHKRTWTDDQITLIESLAAQTSISLEAATLFEAVERERTRLSTVLENLPVGVAVADKDWAKVRLNRVAAAMLGVPTEFNLSELNVAQSVTAFRDNRPLLPEEWPLVRAVRQGQVIRGEEQELLSADGRRLTLLVNAAPIRDRSGEVVGSTCAFADITALKTTQRELDARRREAEESSARKTRFLAAVSHDIRTPANAIGLLGELLQRAGENPSMAAEIPDIAQQLRRSALALVNLVTDVLDLTRMEAGKIDLVESEFDLAELVRDECDRLRPLATEKRLAFECAANQPIWVRADRIKLGRVLQNLLGNAIKFTDMGRVASEVIPLSNGQTGVQIRVTDTGRGIPPEDLPRIFDEFFQLKSRNDMDRGGSSGSGLGLTICKRLIDAMGATLTVESDLGKGSVFTLTLPSSTIVQSRLAFASGDGQKGSRSE